MLSELLQVSAYTSLVKIKNPLRAKFQMEVCPWFLVNPNNWEDEKVWVNFKGKILLTAWTELHVENKSSFRMYA